MTTCTSCGACCASFRVDFSVCELDTQQGQVPSGLTVEVTVNTARMLGTDHVPVRCAALSGKLGLKVNCAIYEWRPSPCRDFEEGSDACAQARRRHAMSIAPDRKLPLN
jgi:Fe-S-cluster containining protein